jgi:DNA primase
MVFSGTWDEAREQVREAADIVQVIGEHVQLRRAGTNFTGLCPFHGEKTPSFSVNPQRRSYHCFGCGESGDVFAFLMKQKNLSFPEAIQELARRYQVSLPEPKVDEAEQVRRRQRDLLHQINAEAAKLCSKFLKDAPQAEAARQYLRRRGVPPEFLDKYQLGYAPDTWDFLSSRLTKQFPAEAVAQAGLIVAKQSGGWYDRFRDRIMFPIVDTGGKIAAFGGRVLGDGQPKYMNSPESLVFSKSRTLFGLHQHRENIRKSRQVVIVEGNFDLLLLDVHGIGNTVAPLGTALTKEQVRSLRAYCSEAVLLFDGDAAGQKAARRSVPLFLSERLEAKAAVLPLGHDPDSFIREKGAAAVQELISTAQPLPEFIFDALVKEHGLTLSGKSKILAELAELAQQAPDRAQRELMAVHFAEKLGMSPQHFLPAETQPLMDMPPMPSAPPPDYADFVVDAPEYGEVHAAAAVQLPANQQRLLEFVVLHPEHFNKLATGGLIEYVSGCAAPVREAIAVMRRLSEAGGTLLPEQLLAVLPDGAARRLIAEIMLRGAGDTPCDEEQSRELCAELLGWLKAAKARQDSAASLLRLRQIQQTGETSEIRRLQRQIQPEIENQSSVN